MIEIIELGFAITFVIAVAMIRGHRDQQLRDKLDEPLGEHYKELL